MQRIFIILLFLLTFPALADEAADKAEFKRLYAERVKQMTDKNYQEYLPLSRVVPQYPARAFENKIEGWVVFSLTIATDGATKNIKVLESSHKMFEQNATKAVRKFTYHPRKINGVATEVENVLNKVVFKLGR